MKQINLLPCREQQGGQKKIEFTFLFFGVLALSFFLIVLFKTLICHQLQKLNSHKNQLVNQLSFVSLAVEKLEQVKQQSEQLQATKKRLHISHEQIRKILSLLHDLNLLAPPRFFIKTISYEMPYLLLIVTAESKVNFLKLIKKLEKEYLLNFKYNDIKNKNLLPEFIVNIRI